MDDITSSSAKRIAIAIQQKQVSAVEVAKEHLKLIDKINPKINALMQVDEKRILDDAAHADLLLSKGKSSGPLHGVPISVKDNFLTKGIITTAGNRTFLSNMPTRDATVVQRLRAAGAIILGKTNLPDFAMCWDTDSTAYGRTNNPYDLNRSAGGSSGGEASLIAAGGSPLGIASDGGGSIRLPAHYCGIAGFRPTIGMVPTSGIFPPAEGSFASGAAGRVLSVGPMSRFVEDLIYCLPIISGADEIDPNTQHNAFTLAQTNIPIKGLRVAYYQNNEANLFVENAIKNVANLLADAGALVDETCPPGVTTSWEIFSGVLCADGAEGLREWLKSLDTKQLTSPGEKALTLFSAKKYSIEEFLSLLGQWDQYRSKLINFMKDYDVIICPVTATPAILNSESFTDAPFFSSENYLAAYSLMGWPCVVVRAGTSEDGLPIGVQIIAKDWHDSIALGVASYIEQVTGGWKTPHRLLETGTDR